MATFEPPVWVNVAQLVPSFEPCSTIVAPPKVPLCCSVRLDALGTKKDVPVSALPIEAQVTMIAPALALRSRVAVIVAMLVSLVNTQ